MILTSGGVDMRRILVLVVAVELVGITLPAAAMGFRVDVRPVAGRSRELRPLDSVQPHR